MINLLAIYSISVRFVLRRMAVRALDRRRKLEDARLGVRERLRVHDDARSEEEQVDNDKQEPERASDSEKKSQGGADNDRLDQLGRLTARVLLHVLLPGVDDCRGQVGEPLAERKEWVDVIRFVLLAFFVLRPERSGNKTDDLIPEELPDVVEHGGESQNRQKAEVKSVHKAEAKFDKAEENGHLKRAPPEEHGLEILVLDGVRGEEVHVVLRREPGKPARWHNFLFGGLLSLRLLLRLFLFRHRSEVMLY